MLLQSFGLIPLPEFNAAFPAPAQQQARELDISNFDQGQDTWCYAACAEMILDYYNKRTPENRPIKQCDIVNTIRPGVQCCTAPDKPPSNCIDRGCEPADIVKIYDKFGLPGVQQTAPISFEAIKAQINQGSPVEVCVQWDATNSDPQLFSAHVVIIRGWFETSFGRYLRILDPLTKNIFGGSVLFEQLQQALGEGAWKLTFLGFPKKQ